MTSDPPGRHVWPVIAVAVAAVSAAAVLVRLAEGVEPVAVAFWRCAVVAALLLPVALRSWSRGGLGLDGAQLVRRDAWLTLLAGALLAGHFAVWFESLHLTSVMRSTVLVCLSPIWAALLEWAVYRQRPTGRYWAGIGLALVGVAWLAGGGSAKDGTLVGDAVALVAGMLSAAYLVVGRTVRQRVGIGPYGMLVSGAAALWLLVAALLSGAPLAGYAAPAWLALLGLALGPQLLGHVGFNYAVRYVPASVITAAILLEPVGATALAVPVLGETPGLRDIAGAVVVLAGVALALRR